MYISALRGRFVERQDTCCHYDDVWKFVTPGRQPHIHSTSSAHLFAREGRKEGRQQRIFSALLVDQWQLNFTFLAVEVISEKYRILILVENTNGFKNLLALVSWKLISHGNGPYKIGLTLNYFLSSRQQLLTNKVFSTSYNSSCKLNSLEVVLN